MFGSNDTETMNLIYKLYMILSRSATAWFKFIQAIFNS